MSKLLFIVAALSVTAPLSAASPVAADVPLTVHIGYTDLDLLTPAGTLELDRRIARAVKMVCPDDFTSVQSRHLLSFRCRRAATAQIAAQRDLALARASQRRAAIATAPARSTSSTDTFIR